MTLKKFKPTTSSQRGLTLVDYSSLWKGRPLKSLTSGKKSTGGRSRGRVTMRHRGGGHKRLYREIDFKRKVTQSVVERVEYDPNRSAFIALMKSEEDVGYSYVIAPDGIKEGDVFLSSSSSVEVKTGNSLCLKNIPVGVLVHNIELKIAKGGQLARSAGASAQIMGRDGSYVLVRLPSGEVRKIHGECRATVGVVSNGDRKNRVIAKAGRNRWLGKRPHVRGVAMNPVDHPHGGGEGKTSGGRHPVSPWGQPAKGKKTRNKKKASSQFIVNRRK